jgi:hypothetical protein
MLDVAENMQYDASTVQQTRIIVHQSETTRHEPNPTASNTRPTRPSTGTGSCASTARWPHWRPTFDENAGLRPGYKLKLNSYDLGVDIELNDAVNRIRFEHPEVRTVVVTSAKEKVFCSGANIFMLGLSSHSWKVNFCKFTNETRNGLEDSSQYSGLKFLAAVNGACAGGGYELALACDEIILVDDRSSAVSLPEVPLLGVLPGTGGLTRVTDKRQVRHDLADLFCTSAKACAARRPRTGAWSTTSPSRPCLPPRCRSVRCNWPPRATARPMARA